MKPVGGAKILQEALTYHFFLIDTPRFFRQKKMYWARVSENQFLYWKLLAFYSAILTSCSRHDVNNVKERRNAVDFAPKNLTL